MLVFHQLTQLKRASGTWRSFLLYIIILTLLLSTAASLFMPAVTASAKRASDMSIDEEIKSFTYLNTLTTCFHNEAKLGGGVTANTDTWFRDNHSSGFVYPDSSSEVDCKDIMNQALALWGYNGNNLKFLTDMGYTERGGTYQNNTDRPGLQTNLIRIASLNVYSTSTQSRPAPIHVQNMSSPAQYVFYATNFNKHCSPQYFGDAKSLTGDIKTQVENNATEVSDKTLFVYRTVPTVSDDGKRIDEGVKYSRDTIKGNFTGQGQPTSAQRDPIIATLYGYHNNTTTLPCQQLAERMFTTVNSFVTHKIENPDEPSPDSDSTCVGGVCGSNTAQSCNIDSIGWMICPVINFLAGVVDKSYGIVEGLLVTPTVNMSTNVSDNALYSAWTVMRNFANITFVIAFMFIIISQLTSFGISNYGIKKLLPKLVLVAILVNISYFLCAAAVDVSNILGKGITTLIDSSSMSLTGGVDTTVRTGGDIWGPLAVTILASVTVALIGISIFLPLVIAAAAAIVTVLLVLVMRQAFIVMLIVIAPIAFVALLLPNTEGMFKKWRSLFFIMLAMFPVIAFIFAGSAMASKIIMSSASPDFGTDDIQTKDILLQTAGAAVAIVPLFITPIVMKAAGGVLNRFAGIVNNPNKGMFDRLKKGAEGVRATEKSAMRARRLNGKSPFSPITRTRANFRARADKTKAKEEAADAGYLLRNKHSNEASQIRMATSAAGSARQSGALQSLDKESQLEALGMSGIDNPQLSAALRGQVQSGEKQAVQEVEAQISFQSAGQLGDSLKKAMMEGNAIAAQAAQNLLDSKGNAGATITAGIINDVEKEGGGKDWVNMRTELARNMSGGMMAKNEALKKWSVNTEVMLDENGQPKLDENGKEQLKTKTSLQEYSNALMQPGGAGGMSVEKFLKQTPDVQQQLVSSGAIHTEVMRNALNENNIGGVESSVIDAIRARIDGKNAPLKVRAEANAAKAAEGTAGIAPFVVDGSGSATSTNTKQAAQGDAIVAAAGTTGTQPFVVDSKGVTELKINHSETNNTTNNSATQVYSTNTVSDGRRSTGATPDATGSGTLGAPKHKVTPYREATSSYLPPKTPGTDPTDIPRNL